MLENSRRLVAATIGAFVLWTAFAGQFESLVQRSVMVALLLLLGFLTYPLRPGGRTRGWSIALDVVLAGIGIAAAVYVTFNANRIMTTLPMASPLELGLTLGLVVVLLELARRTVGLAFPILVIVGLSYVFLGHLIPGRLGHRGFDVYFIAETIYLSDIGVWGSLTGLASTLIAAFVLFGAVLLHTGGGKTFMDIALLVSGRSIGGAAKMATIASASFGTVNGSAVANVATTGTLTIPLMKRLNYPPQFAAAVEAVASTGGQVTPPILGAAAFIMAEMIGVEYLRIALAAVIPAAMFYIAVLLTIHLVALRSNVGLVPREEIPSARQALDPLRLIPVLGGLGGLIFMLVSGRSVAYSAAIGIACMLIPFVIGDLWRRRNVAATSRTLFDALVEGGAGIVIIGVMLAGAQILVSLLNLTGIGVTLSSLVVAIGGQNIVLIGLIVAGSCLILGMGIPTTAAYVLVASVMAPALIAVQVEPLVAHMFVFYYATISVITPPVCIAVFVAASIANVGWWPVALNAVRLGAVTYVVPFMFLAYPGMLWSGSGLGIAEAALSGLVLVISTAMLTSGVSLRGSRMLAGAIFAPSALLALYPNELALGAAIILLCIGIHLAKPFHQSQMKLVPGQ
ncbi:TRAP transporter fused permease subunit [Aliihoeflea sp. 2WW]|uniref:TRAP transporter permease n=1 Tax=Aliihoeflea sp. 2WW TaxID=1381123 RepID=UPI0004651C78|nr:TRAP transporter fused permease subunit [Aliihoeflea sp. 2WW]